jgi:hypothetical protein
MKILLIFITLFLSYLLSSCTDLTRHELKVCKGDYDIQNDYKWTYKVPKELVLSIDKKKVNIEGTGDSFDGQYEICKETESFISFELNCIKKTVSEFKSTDEFVKYLVHTRKGGGDFNKISGRLELTHFPLGLNDGYEYVGEFRCENSKK